MSWIDKLKFWNKQSVKPIDPALRFTLFPVGSYIPAALSLSQAEMLTLGTVFACIRLIAESIAQCSWLTYTRDYKGQREILHDDSTAWLLNLRPNPDITGQAFWEAMLFEMIASGNAYAEISYDNAGRVNSLWPIPSNTVQAKRNQSGELEYHITQQNGPFVVLPAWRILHFRGICLDGLLGSSVLNIAARAVVAAVAAEKYGSYYFANAATPSGLLIPKQGLTAEQQKLLADAWKTRTGVGNQHSLAIMTNDMTYEALQDNASQAQLVEVRAQDVENTARFFGVPLVLLSVGSSSQGYGTNISQLYRSFTRSTLNPYIKRLQQECSFKLFPQRSPWRELVLDPSDLTRPEPSEVAATNEVLIRSGQRTINECRSADNYSPVKGGDTVFVGSGLKPLEQALTPPKPEPIQQPQPNEPQEDDEPNEAQ